MRFVVKKGRVDFELGEVDVSVLSVVVREDSRWEPEMLNEFDPARVEIEAIVHGKRGIGVACRDINALVLDDGEVEGFHPDFAFEKETLFVVRHGGFWLKKDTAHCQRDI